MMLLARQGADDFVDSIVAEGFPSFDVLTTSAQEAFGRRGYEIQQYDCIQEKPVYYDVREVSLDGTRAAVLGDRGGKPTSFWLILDNGRFAWQPTARELAAINAGDGACG